MNQGVGRMQEIRAGEAFAAHLRARNDASAKVLADRLEDVGEWRRAEYLRRFVEFGDHDVDADWWAKGTTCHVSLKDPTATSLGELWFDPLEVTFCLVEPGLYLKAGRATLDARHYWVSLTTVAAWQIRGAHAILPRIPVLLHDVCGDESILYIQLFGKGLCGSYDWQALKNGYGNTVLRHVWGEVETQQGSGTGISGEVEIIDLSEVLEWPSDSSPSVETISDLEEAGLLFRTIGSSERRGSLGELEIERVWNA